MAPCFTVLADPGKKLTNLHVAETLKKYYPFTVDGVNTTGLMIKNKYAGSNAKFFSLDMDDWLMVDIETVDLIPPSFMLTFDKTKKVTKKEWRTVYRWVDQIFRGELSKDLEEEMNILVPKPAELPQVVTMLNQKIPETILDKRDYNFNYQVDEDFDRCLCQVDKPYTDKPYTVVIRNFKQRDFLPLFTALFVCNSWGVCNQDIAFLAQVWTYLAMEKYGELDLETRLKEDIEKCSPKEGRVPEAEPEVYRLTIDEVKTLWSGKQKRIAEEIEARKIVRLEK